jgi:heme exporter protein D
MPDLGSYAFAVLSSYGATILLVAGLIGLTVWQRLRVLRRLAEVEGRQAQRAAE